MTIAEDIEELVGGSVRQTFIREERLRREAAKKKAFEERIATGKQGVMGSPDGDIIAVRNGVTATWIAQALSMSVGTVRVKLAKCPTTTRDGKNIYNLAETLPYLVKPKLNLDLKTLKKEDLPTHLQDSYWSAMLKRQQWEENAKHLWHSEDVMQVFGATFQAIKFAIQLWVDDMERATAITPEQYRFLLMKADELQQKIYDELVKIPSQRATVSTSAQHKEEPADPAVDPDIANLV